MSRYCFILFFILAVPAVFGQATLEYKLRKGDVFTFRQEAVQQIVQEIDGGTNAITNSIKGVLEFRVLGLKDHAYEIAVAFKELTIFMSSSNEGELLNIKAGDEDSEDLQARIFNSLLNVPIRILLDHSGDVIEVVGGDSLVTRMAIASGIEDAFTLDVIKESLKKDFGSEALSNSYEQMLYLYPKDKIRIGDSWENKYKGTISSSNHWTLNALNDGRAIIHGSASVFMNLQEEAAIMQLEGERQTEVATDLATGFLLAMKVESRSQGFSILPQLGDTNIPTTIKSTITYKRI